jgi:3-dehydroquinate synthase
MELLVLVAEQRSGGWQVAACDGDGRVSAAREYGPGKWQEQLAEWVGAFGADSVRAVALLALDSDSREYPTTETLLPCPVVSLPRELALAAFAPADWPRFAVVDANGGCGLVTRSEASRFYYARGTATDSCDAAQDFGYRVAVTDGDCAMGFAAVERVSREGYLRAGAARLTVAALAADGVCRTDAGGRPVLRLARRGATTYEIIHCDEGAFDPENDCLARIVNGRPALFAVDVNVLQLYGQAISEYATARLRQWALASVRPGDASKTWSQVAYLCEQACRARLPRDGIIVGVGGGVTLDVAGLAASLYHRGTPYLRVPTTLLGMVDVAVGIKHGVNFNGAKNVLGSFYPPLGAINDFSFLKSLPEPELANGFSEIIKVGLVRDSLLFAWVEKHGGRLVQSGYQDPPEWGKRIALRAEHVMMADLQPNLHEHDRRRFPDFGHTFSGAIEEASDYAVSHGAAVAADMLLATIISVRRGLCGEEVLGRLITLYRTLGLLTLPEACTGDVLASALQAARLRRGGHLHMVAPQRVGEGCFLEDVTVEESCRALERAAAICAPQRRRHAGAGD